MIDERRLIDLAIRLVSTPSFTGSEEAAAELVRDELASLGLQVQWQQVEEGRANVLGTWPGEGGGPTLMFNGHLDTSYSGREPWLQGIPGFQPEGFERDGRIYGLGISNMKGAVACYVEAVRSLIEDGVRLRGDVMIAAVAGEIEKTQEGDAQGAEYRGYAAGSRHLVGHGGAADMCILGEPTENKVVLAHFGTLWLRLRTRGPFIHTAFSAGRQEENSIVRMGAVLERGARLAAELGGGDELRRRPRGRQRRRDPRRLRLARLAERRTRPTSTSTSASRPRFPWRRPAGRRSSSPAASTASRRRRT